MFKDPEFNTDSAWPDYAPASDWSPEMQILIRAAMQEIDNSHPADGSAVEDYSLSSF